MNQSGFGIFGNQYNFPIMATGESTKKTSKKKSDSNAVSRKYKMPEKFLFDSLRSIPCDKTGEGTKQELMEWIAQKTGYKFFLEHESSFTIEIVGKNYLIRPVSTTVIEKGNSGTQLLLESLKNLDEILDPDDKGQITCEKVKDYIKNTYGITVVLHLIGSTYIPVPCNRSNGKIENLKFPIKATSLSLCSEEVEISAQDYENFQLNSKSKNSDSKKEKDCVSDSVLREILYTLFPEYVDDLQYVVDETANMLYVYHKFNENKNSVSSQKEELYPTTAEISLIFTRIQLSPEQFKGASEITKKELINFIGKDYPEYSMERTEIQYDKKKNLIIPILKSGKRGSLSSYRLEDTSDFRFECSPLMSIFVSKRNSGQNGCSYGNVHFNLPKIPFMILKQLVLFFWDVFVFYHTEAIAQIFYNPQEKAYHVYIPQQESSASSVEFIRNSGLEHSSDLILVMEIHSHGFHPAFWSATDNEEELGHCFYAVLGDLPGFCYDQFHIKIRGATGGYHVEVSPDAIFEFPLRVEEFNKMLLNVKKI